MGVIKEAGENDDCGDDDEDDRNGDDDEDIRGIGQTGHGAQRLGGKGDQNWTRGPTQLQYDDREEDVRATELTSVVEEEEKETEMDQPEEETEQIPMADERENWTRGPTQLQYDDREEDVRETELTPVVEEEEQETEMDQPEEETEQIPMADEREQATEMDQLGEEEKEEEEEEEGEEAAAIRELLSRRDALDLKVQEAAALAVGDLPAAQREPFDEVKAFAFGGAGRELSEEDVRALDAVAICGDRDGVVLAFLRHAKFDVPKAKESIRRCCAWRRENEVNVCTIGQ